MSHGTYFGFKISLLSGSDCSNKNNLKRISETFDSSRMNLSWILIGIIWILKIVLQRITIFLYQCFHQSQHFKCLLKQPYKNFNKITLHPAINCIAILIMPTPSTSILFVPLEKNKRNSFLFKFQQTNSRISKIYSRFIISKNP